MISGDDDTTRRTLIDVHAIARAEAMQEAPAPASSPRAASEPPPAHARVGDATPDPSPDPATPPGPPHVSLEETALGAKEAKNAQHAAVHARRANIRAHQPRTRRPAR